MKIYQQEIIDGISELVRSNASIQANVLISTPQKSQAQRNIKSPDNREPGALDPDLYALRTVLVSSGWNKNDDVFAIEELYKAKNTPVNKKIDYQHDELIIIGHISNAYLVDKSGNILDTPL